MLLRNFKSLLLATAIGLPAVGNWALAVPVQAQAAAYTFSSQDLGAALTALSNASGHKIIFSAAAVAGKTSAAFADAPTFEAALNAMLAGTGLSPTVKPDGSALVSAAASKDATVSAVVVTGRRATTTAVDLQMAASNTTSVLTPADLARTPDQNVAESLSRLPGITVLDGGFGNTIGVPVDEAARGEGNFVEVRGLNAEFNIDLINGVDAAQGMPYSREVQLDLLPPTGLQKIVVNKSFGADIDGDAIGAVIDFRTPNAFDFEAATHGSLSMGGQLDDRALDYDRNGGGGSVSADLSHKFGNAEQFGVYVSGYYNLQNFTNSIVDGIYPAQDNGEYTYAIQNQNGTSASGLNAGQNLVLTGANAGFTTGAIKRYGGNFSLDWRPDANDSAYLRATYARDDTDQQTAYLQYYGANVTNAEIGTTGQYTPVIGAVQPRYFYETNPEQADLATIQLGGVVTTGQLHISPNIYVSYGENNDPDEIQISGRLHEVADAFPFGGSQLFTYNNGVPVPIATASQLAQVANVSAYGARREGDLYPEFSEQLKEGAKLDATYDVNDGVLETISAGVKFDDSTRGHTVRGYETKATYTTDANDPSFGSLGLFNGSVAQLVPGYYNFSTPTLSESGLFSLFYNKVIPQFGNVTNASEICGGGVVNSQNCDTQRGMEAVAAGYVNAKLLIDGVEIIPGFRFEHTQIENTFWVQGVSAFSQTHTTYDKPLPSVLVNYRPNSFSVYRASIAASYVKPSFFQLGGGAQETISDGVTTITEGNPNLKAIDAVNYDASGAWTSTTGSSGSVAVFYKSLQHYFFDTVDPYAGTSSPYTGAVSATSSAGGQTTVISRPENGGSGEVYGLELGGEQKFLGAPAPLDGFGVAGNITFEKSSVHTLIAGLAPTERLLNQPNLATNVRGFYEKGPFQVDLTYRYTSDYEAQYGTLGANSALDTWVRANEKLDLHMGYLSPWAVRFEASISNLTGENSYYATVGKTATTIPSIVDSGRTYIIKASYNFN